MSSVLTWCATNHAWRLPAGRSASLAAGMVLGLAACGSGPLAPPSSAAPPTSTPSASINRTDGVDAFERQQRERAEIAQRQGRLADATVAWEALSALKPQRADYRERLASVRSQIQTATEDRLGRASAAHKRGDIDAAVQHYLAALALEPTNETAADALRGIERERQKRQAGRLGREPQLRRSCGEMDPRPAPPAAPVRSPVRSVGAGAEKTPKLASPAAVR